MSGRPAAGIEAIPTEVLSWTLGQVAGRGDIVAGIVLIQYRPGEQGFWSIDLHALDPRTGIVTVIRVCVGKPAEVEAEAEQIAADRPPPDRDKVN